MDTTALKNTAVLPLHDKEELRLCEKLLLIAIAPLKDTSFFQDVRKKYRLSTKIQKNASAKAILVKTLQYSIALIDKLLNVQVNAILHHPKFQQLEGSWRGLYYLVDQSLGIHSLKIKVLDISWNLLAKDLNHVLEFDQSQLFKKIYSHEFDYPGGEPFGLLLGDYFISHRSDAASNINPIETLRNIASVAAAAFAPFITAISPEMLGLDRYTDLHSSLNLLRTFQQVEYLHWKKLRDMEDARFLGLTLPRVLARLPYTLDNERGDGFCFHETTLSTDHYLWANSAYCFAAIVVRAFGQSGWFAELRGIERNAINKGLVTGLLKQRHQADLMSTAYKPATDAWITGNQEKDLSELGFIALCECQYTEAAVFYSCPSLQRSKTYDHNAANHNAELSSMLHYILCVSRFAHYIKIIVRNKVGSFINPKECESYLQQWLLLYTADTEDMSATNKAKYPLRETKVQVRELTGKVGSYACTIHLRPYFQIERIESSLALMTELTV